MHSERKLGAIINFYLCVVAGAATTQPAQQLRALDLSTPAAAAVTHWNTLAVTDPVVIRAQYDAASPAEAHALDVGIDSSLASMEFDAAVLAKFGDAALAPKGFIGPDAKRPDLGSIRWKVDGSAAVPINPPAEAGERRLVLKNGKWLQPVSIWWCTDDRRLSELSRQTAMYRTLTSEIRSGKYKDVAETSAAWQKVLGETEPRFMLLPPVYLPDTNETTPSGALAALAMAIAEKNLQGVSDRFASSDDKERAFTQGMVDWIGADVALDVALVKKFGAMPTEQFWETSGLNTPSLFAYAILSKIDQAQVTKGADDSHVTIGVPSALVWEMRKSGDRWQLSARDSMDDLGFIGGQHKLGDAVDTVPPRFEHFAVVEASIARDVAAGKIATLKAVKDVFEREAETQQPRPATNP